MERLVIESENLVSETIVHPGGVPKYHEARQTLWESGSVTIQG